jgi:hypothetical protein
MLHVSLLFDDLSAGNAVENLANRDFVVEGFFLRMVRDPDAAVAYGIGNEIEFDQRVLPPPLSIRRSSQSRTERRQRAD